MNISATNYRAMSITVAESSRSLLFSAPQIQDCWFETHSGCKSKCRPCYGPVSCNVFEGSIIAEVRCELELSATYFVKAEEKGQGGGDEGKD